MSVSINEEILTPEQVAELLGCSRKIIEAKLRAGELVGSKRVGRWYVLRSDLIAWIEAGRQPVPARRKKK